MGRGRDEPVMINARARVNSGTRAELNAVLRECAELTAIIPTRKLDWRREVDVRPSEQMRQVAVAAVVVKQIFLRSKAHALESNFECVSSVESRGVRLGADGEQLTPEPGLGSERSLRWRETQA